jgi:hypothetical protein
VWDAADADRGTYMYRASGSRDVRASYTCWHGPAVAIFIESPLVLQLCVMYSYSTVQF